MTKTHKEDSLFDNMFEIVLKEDYEDHFMFRELEKKDIDARKHLEFMRQINMPGKRKRSVQ